MMDKILWKALFCERTVSYGQALYDRNYLNIWFQEETFEAFLTSQSTDVKLDCAKKLYAALRSQESVFIPSSIIETNLHEQLHKLSPSNTDALWARSFPALYKSVHLGHLLVFQ